MIDRAEKWWRPGRGRAVPPTPALVGYVRLRLGGRLRRSGRPPGRRRYLLTARHRVVAALAWQAGPDEAVDRALRILGRAHPDVTDAVLWRGRRVVAVFYRRARRPGFRGVRRPTRRPAPARPT
jgi:hypothetical protein